MYAGGCTYLCSQPPADQTVQKRRCGEGNTLFGPHAKFSLQNSPPVNVYTVAVDGEGQLMNCMRAKLGPYASESALLYHLRAARGKVFWAVNTYFRAVLAEQVRRADFEPKQYAQLANCQSPASQACDQESDANVQQLTFDSLPASVVEHVLQQTDLFTACSAAAASRGLRQAVESDMVWRTLFKRRWGDLVRTQHSTLCQSDTLRSCTDQHPEPSTWRETYRQRHLAEHSMQCPTCRQSKLVPIVYGFPSHLLVRNMRANKLRMGNDHLIEGQPIWTCTACAEEFTKFPYMSLELVCV